VFLQTDGDTELARAVDVMMARAKRIDVLIIKVNSLFSFSSSRCFLKEIENMFSVFILSYRNTGERLGELEKAVETLACGSCSNSISRSLKVPLLFLWAFSSCKKHRKIPVKNFRLERARSICLKFHSREPREAWPLKRPRKVWNW